MEKAVNFLKNQVIKKFNRRGKDLIEFGDFLKWKEFFEFIGYPYIRNVYVSHERIRKNFFNAAQVMGVGMMFIMIYSCLMLAREKKGMTIVESTCYPEAHLNLLIRFLYFFIYKRESIMDIFEKLHENFPHHGLDQHFYGVRKYLKELNIIGGIIVYFNFITAFQFAFCTFELAIYGWWTSQEVEYIPIYSIEFPFDSSSPFVKWPIHFVELFTEMTLVITYNSTEQVYAALMTLTTMQFDILAKKISEAETAEELKELIAIHQQLIEITQKLEDIFSPVLLANIFVNILVSCVGAFMAASGTSTTFLLKYGSTITLACPIGYTQCRLVQNLIDSCDAVGFAAYDTPWFEKDLEFRKLILTIMTKAQKRQQMTAWKFFGVSMETYYWILQTSYSYFSFLMGTQEA